MQYDPNKINLHLLIEAHLLTHSSSSDHAMRNKYRSAVYYLSGDDKLISEQILQQLTQQHKQNYVTMTLPLVAFKSNDEKYLNYFKNNKKAPFCQNHIAPKVKKLEEYYDGKINQISSEQ